MLSKINIQGDKGIWTIVTLLALISLLVVYSSIVTLADKHHQGNTFYYLFRHGVFLSVGLSIIYWVSRIKFKYFSKFSLLAIYTSIPLLAYTLFGGTNINQASRWITLPIINQTFQTSDFAKLALIMYVARTLAVRQFEINNYKELILHLILPIVIVCGLIFPANLSTATVLFASALSLMFVGRVSLRLLIATITVILIGFSGLFFIGKSYPEFLPTRFNTWVNRIENFTQAEHQTEETAGNYQAINAKIAIARGGLTGVGPGKSVQRNVLPHPYSDFIYAIVIEEYGVFGGIGLLILYMLFLFRCVIVILKANSVFGKLLVCGIGFLMVFQALINMGVTSGLLPVTGQPLPLISMGGTSIWFTCLSIGIILSVSASSSPTKSVTRKTTSND